MTDGSPNLPQPRKRQAPAQVILERLAAIPKPERGRTRILDLPAGDGVLLLPLHLAGFAVTGCDLFPEYARATVQSAQTGDALRFLQAFWPRRPPLLVREILRGGPADRGGECRVVKGDMEERLPFEDASFDLVVSAEGIEHIDGQGALLQEIRRVLRPGGRLLVSTPNTLCLRSRLACALTGQRTLNTVLDEYTGVQDRSGSRVYHGHAFLVDYFELRYLLYHAGFRIESVLPTRASPSSVALAPLMAPPVVLCTALALRRKARRSFLRMLREGKLPQGAVSPYGQIARHVLSSAVLFGKNLVVEAVAEGEPPCAGFRRPPGGSTPAVDKAGLGDSFNRICP